MLGCTGLNSVCFRSGENETSYHRLMASTGFEPAHLGSTRLIYETACDSQELNLGLVWVMRMQASCSHTHEARQPKRFGLLHMLLSLGGYARRRDTGDRLCRAKRSIRVERMADPCIAYIARAMHPDLLIHQGCMMLIRHRRA